MEIAEPLGSDTLIFSRIREVEIIGRISAVSAPAIGSSMRLHAHLNHMHLFDPDSGVALYMALIRTAATGGRRGK